MFPPSPSSLAQVDMYAWEMNETNFETFNVHVYPSRSCWCVCNICKARENDPEFSVIRDDPLQLDWPQCWYHATFNNWGAKDKYQVIMRMRNTLVTGANCFSTPHTLSDFV